jgi:hypothetical protein
MKLARLYAEDTTLERWAQHFEDVPPEFREFVQQAHTVVRQRHLPGQWHPATADRPYIGDRAVRGATARQLLA